MVNVEFLGSGKQADGITPLVSVVVLTYNQKDYIAECLDGILIQKVNFPIEIVLGEDESTDGTREICIEYAEKHPEIIRLFLRREKDKIYINGKKTGRFNNIESLKVTRGKYIAFCEGDDYWTDPYKLQKQVDFLERNPEYGMVHTDCDILKEKEGVIICNYHASRSHVTQSGNIYEFLLNKNLIDTCTVCIRKEFIVLSGTDYSYMMADYPLWLEVAHRSKIGYLPESTTTRRIRLESASQSSDASKQFQFNKSAYKIKFDYIRKYGCSDAIYRSVRINYIKLLLHRAVVSNNKKLLVEASTIMPLNSWPFAAYLLWVVAQNKLLRVLYVHFKKKQSNRRRF